MISTNDYEAALAGPAYYLHSDSGCLSLAGPDRVDFLHRQSTGDLRVLSPDHAVITVLTTPTARILDVLWVLAYDERLLLLTLPGRGERTANYLKSKIFFMDKVTVTDESSQYAQLDLLGPQAGDLLRSLSILPPSGVGGISQIELLGYRAKVLRLDGWPQDLAYRLCVRSAAVSSLVEFLQERGVAELEPETWRLMRIEFGIPGELGELTEEYTPLEVGLDDAVSDSKGCYTGQEILARQVTYDKVVRRLVGIKLSNQVEPGTEILVDGRSVGILTSVGQSPRFGDIGLAILRRTHAKVGATVALRNNRNTIGLITGLPFAE